MGQELPDGVNLPKFVWQKGSPHRKKKSPGSGKGGGKAGAMAILFVVASLSFTLGPFIWIAVQHIKS